jgi:two-component system, cell cycle sensor histidine kinase and response regulator CckA
MSESRLNILLIEDNLAEARFLQETLKGGLLKRFNLVHVVRLGDALQQVNQQSFDAILLDLTLPDSQGLVSLDAIAHHAPNLPIVVLTNTNDDFLALEAVRQGAQDYLVKRHVNGEVLVRSLQYAIERKQVSKALQDANDILEVRVQERTAELAEMNERLKAEVQIRQQAQERLELAQRVGRIGTFEWNIQSNEVVWTAELEALYGFSPGSFSQYDNWLQTIHPDDRSRTEQEFWLAVREGKELNTEFRIVCLNGESHWIAAKSNVFCDEAGKPLRMLGIHMDITEKKQLEAQFLQAQRLESLGTLASGIAHDLNNILTPILAITQLLPLKLKNLNEKEQQMLTLLESSARRGADLVKQILSFARGIEGRRVSLRVEHVLLEIKEIIQETFLKSIEIRTDIAANLWGVSADATQLHQVLMNLCVNARDAMMQGGVLSISAENQWLDEQDARLRVGAQAGPYVKVTIADTGVGISPQIIHRIFDPFFTTKAVGKGTGLGLSAVLGIVKSYDGFVEVRSVVGQGSQFVVYLPAIQETVPSTSIDSETLNGQGELILVVDDEVSICEVMKTTLELHSYRVLTANDGAEAIALFAEHQSELSGVLIDIIMPAMDGLTTIPVLQKLQPTIKIIAMGGLGSNETITQVERLGSYFLAKPFTTKELLQALKRVLEVN